MLQFTRSNGTTVFVNPMLVRRVQPHSMQPDDHTIIHFDKEDYVSVEGAVDLIANRIASALAD